MAILNSPVADTQDPNWMGYSKPIGDIPANQTIGKALEGLGNTGSAAIKVADYLVEDYLKKDIQSNTDKERERYTGNLDSTYRDLNPQPGSGPNRSANASTDPNNPYLGAPLSISPTGNTGTQQTFAAGMAEPGTTPEELSHMGTQLDNMNGAKRISSTYYAGILADYAKDLRSRYPGYRDFIDQQIEKQTGFNPANKYITSMTTDINQQLRASMTDVKQFEHRINEMVDNGYPGWAGPGGYKQAWKEGRMTNAQIDEYINRDKGLEHFYKMDEKRTNWKEKNIKEIEGDATRSASLEAGMHFDRTMDNIKIAGKVWTKDEINNQITRWQNGDEMVDSTKANQLAQAIEGAGRTSRSRIWARWNQTPPEGGMNMVQRLGGEVKAGQILDKQMQETFGVPVEAIRAKDWGLFQASTNLVKGMQNDEERRMYSHPTIGPPLLKLKAISQFPDYAKEMFGDIIKDPKLAPGFKNYFLQEVGTVITQPTNPNTGQPRTMTDTITEAQTHGFQNPDSYKKFVGMVKSVTTNTLPDDEKLKFAHWAFSDGNQGVISKFFQRDGYDDKGRPISGQISVYRSMTNLEMAKEIYRLGAKDPTIIPKYNAWVSRTIDKELLPQEIKDLQGIQGIPGVQLKWDDKNNLFEPVFDRARYGDKNPFAARGNDRLWPAGSQEDKINSTINRINMILPGLTNIARASGGAVDNDAVAAFIFRTLGDMGYKPTGGTTGLPADMMRAIMANELQKARDNRNVVDFEKDFPTDFRKKK